MGNHGVWADDEIHLASQQEYIIEGRESNILRYTAMYHSERRSATFGLASE